MPTMQRRPWPSVALAIVLAALCLGVVATAEATAATKPSQVVHAAGSTVKELQRALGIAADGIYGPQTRRAVRRFQRRHRLVVDGIAGRQTLRALGIQARSASKRARKKKKDASPQAVLARIAQCESGGNPRAVSANRRYFGKYQFSRPTWRSVGGKGNPARAPEAEQDRRARILYDRSGTSPWPACSRS